MKKGKEGCAGLPMRGRGEEGGSEIKEDRVREGEEGDLASSASPSSILLLCLAASVRGGGDRAEGELEA